jgi:hypothetical protein
LKPNIDGEVRKIMIGTLKIQVKPEEIIEAIKGMEKKTGGFSGRSYCSHISRIS